MTSTATCDEKLQYLPPKRGNERSRRPDLWGETLIILKNKKHGEGRRCGTEIILISFEKKKRQRKKGKINDLNSTHNCKACYLKRMTRRSGVVTSSHKKKLLYTRTRQKIFVCKTPGIYFKLLPQTVKLNQLRKNIHMPVCNGLNIT